MINSLFVYEFLVIELSSPYDSNLFPLPGKKRHKTKRTRISNRSKWKWMRAGDANEHPQNWADKEHCYICNQVDISTSRWIEPSHISHCGAWEGYSSDGEPRTFLIVNSIDSRKLKLKWVVELVQYCHIVRYLNNKVKQHNKNDLNNNSNYKGHKCNFHRCYFDNFYAGYYYRNGYDIIDNPILFRSPPCNT